MQAVISGQACTALLMDGDSLTSIHYEDMDRLVSRRPEEFSNLFGTASDLDWVDVESIDAVRDRLVDAVDKLEAFNLVIYLCDDRLSSDTLKSAAEELEELIGFPEIVSSLEDVFFAKPLPASTDLSPGIAACTFSESQKSATFLQRLLNRQEAIKAVRLAWHSIDPEKFDEIDRDSAESICLRRGLFSHLVNQFAEAGLVKPESLNAALRDELSNITELVECWARCINDQTKRSAIDHNDVTAPVDTHRRGYHLLTGATGLLGNYLLRDLSLANIPVAVIVRSNRRQTARQRIEAVMCRWEEEIGRMLPRPVVLEGDISQVDLGLDPVALRWIANYCSTVIHNAASLTFHSTSEDGEPWRSNVGGVKNVLDLCRNTQIRNLHHVSTAYVSGLRTDRVLESELDVGQEFSNDYECSKRDAEKLVRKADFLDSVTVFRPAIIIGDSKTGLATTYHGYYAALQLSHMIVKAIPPDETGLVGGQKVRLTVTGTETKHLVPVDWVSAVMVHVMTHPELHSQTYHLTPRHPVTTRMIRDVLEQAVGFYGATLVGVGDRPRNASEAEALFYEHIRVYNSYWKTDPTFDRTNTEQAAPHLPCPHVDRDLLYKLSLIVIANDFPGPSKRPMLPEFDVESHLQTLIEQLADEAVQTSDERLLGLNVIGHGGGQWQLIVRGDRVIGLEPGNHVDRQATCRLDVETFAALVHGKTTWSDALWSGRIEVIGTIPRKLFLTVTEQLVDENIDSFVEC